MNPTAEQTHVVDLAKRGNDLKVIAFAGAGKTTTLKLVSHALAPKRGLYLAFNKAIVQSLAGKLPPHVEAKTFHALAFRSHGAPISHKLQKRLTGAYVAERLGLHDLLVETELREMRKIRASTIGYYVSEITKALCRHPFPELPADLAPLIDVAGITDAQKRDLRAKMTPLAHRLFDMMMNPQDDAPASHDAYAKAWVMSGAKLNYGFVLFDEGQDADQLQLAMVGRQSCQKIFVGDPNQSIYAFRGAVNAMAKVKAEEAYLTQSFRFGQEIADRAQIVLWALGCNRKLLGTNKPSTVGPLAKADAELYRTNAACIGRLVQLHREGQGDGVSATGTASALTKIKAIEALRMGRGGVGEFALFRDYSELMEFVESGSGGDLKPMVELEKEYGADELGKLLTRASEVRSPRLTLSVAHQAKGLEWGSVKMGADFRFPPTQEAIRRAEEEGRKPPREPNDEEHRLLYVALTRAENRLDDRAVEYDGYLERIIDKTPPGWLKNASPSEVARDIAAKVRPAAVEPAVRKALSQLMTDDRAAIASKVAADHAARLP